MELQVCEEIVVAPFFSTVVLNNVDTMQRAQALEQTSGAGMLRCYVDRTCTARNQGEGEWSASNALRAHERAG